MRAIYAFSGDPITLGHIDIIERAAATYDHVIVGIGANPKKIENYLFSVEERLTMARRSVAHLANVECTVFAGLLAQFAYRNDCNVIIRGIRNSSDLEAELTLYNVNQLQFSAIDTVFLPTRPTLSHVSSSVVRALVNEGGNVSDYVPNYVKQKLEQKINRRIRIGVTGGIGAGKTHVAAHLEEAIPMTRRIDLNDIAKYILDNSPEPAYKEARKKIIERYGNKIRRKNGSIDRRLLGSIVFEHPGKLKKLNEIILKPILAHLYKKMTEENDMSEATDSLETIILESGLFVESRLTHLVNHCVILVTSPEKVKIKRLVETRGMSEDEARQKIRREISDKERRAYLQAMVDNVDNAFLIEFNDKDGKIPASFVKKVSAQIDLLANN